MTIPHVRAGSVNEAPLTALSQLCTATQEGAVAIDGDTTIDRQTFARDVAALAGRLGPAQGRRWIVADANAYRLAVGIFGVLHAGADAVLPANLGAGHITGLAGQAAGIITGEQDLAKLAGALPPHGHDATTMTRAPSLGPLDPAQARVILHTSGTTGVPVAVEKPLRCLEAEMTAQTLREPLPVGSTVVATVPPYHIYGLLFRVLWPLATGRPFAAATIAYPEQLMAAAVRWPGCTLISSPAFLKRAVEALDLDRLHQDLGPVFSSGGPLPPSVAATYNARLATPIIEVYGSTETGGIATRSVVNAAAPPPWKPLPMVDVKATDTGHLLAVRSPFLSADGWFQTSDRAELLDDGGFVLQGRADRVAKVEDHRVSLPEIDQRLCDNALVEAARTVVLAQGPSARQVLGAVIVLPDAGWQQLADTGALRTELTAMLRPYYAAAVLPRRWRFVRQIPEDARGKTNDAALAALFEPDLGRVTEPVFVDTKADGMDVSLEIELPQDLSCFDGHFDGAPILPGVVQIDWAIKYARRHFDIPDRFSRIEALKFFNVLTAGDRVHLNLNYDPQTATLRFQFLGTEKKYSGGRVKFGGAP
jgi:acyl-CoA synthetase (AMP-forming)/AMP-acid ligase II